MTTDTVFLLCHIHALFCLQIESGLMQRHIIWFSSLFLLLKFSPVVVVQYKKKKNNWPVIQACKVPVVAHSKNTYTYVHMKLIPKQIDVTLILIGLMMMIRKS